MKALSHGDRIAAQLVDLKMPGALPVPVPEPDREVVGLLLRERRREVHIPQQRAVAVAESSGATVNPKATRKDHLHPNSPRLAR